MNKIAGSIYLLHGSMLSRNEQVARIGARSVCYLVAASLSLNVDWTRN